MIAQQPPPLPDGICPTCQGSGCEPGEFYASPPVLNEPITACPTCHGSGTTNTGTGTDDTDDEGGL